MGHQLGRVVSEMTVQIIQGVRISEGQIIRAILYKAIFNLTPVLINPIDLLFPFYAYYPIFPLCNY